MSPTLLHLFQKPFFQAIVCLLCTIVVLAVARPKHTDAVYSTAGIIQGLFVLSNSLVVCVAPRVWPYFFHSLLCSVAYAMAAFFLTSLYIHLMKMKGSAEGSMVFLLIIYHPFSLLLIIFLQGVYHKIFPVSL